MIRRLNYLKRIFSAYISGADSQLTFWHGEPEVNGSITVDKLGPYYMLFESKANYTAYLDEAGIPQLNYHGTVGLQYNPIAIAQYGLGNYNRIKQTGDDHSYKKFIKAANWLVENLELNEHGIYVWNHYFDWEYRDTLLSPWYSALSQGQGISCLLRAHQLSGEKSYMEAAEKALGSFLVEMNQGGVVHRDSQGYLWLEEVIVYPPTHILNGFLWAIWGLYDYYIYTNEPKAKDLFDQGVKTLIHYLPTYDTGFWSLYEYAGKKMMMLASPFYHSLHIVQLRVMSILTNQEIFETYTDKWKSYQGNFLNRYYSLMYKVIFKIFYY